MEERRQPWLVVLLLLSAGVGCWLMLRGDVREPDEPSGSAGGSWSAPAEVEAHEGELSASRSIADGVVSSQEDQTKPGALLVLVRTENGELPIPHASVELSLDDGGEAPSRFAVTDVTGEVQFDAVPSGGVFVATDRRLAESEPVRAVIASGKTTELVIDVSAGVDATITVVDADGTVVPGADVLLWPASGLLDAPSARPGRVIGKTNSSGTLELLALPNLGFASHSSWVAARHPRFGASLARMVAAPETEGDRPTREILLRLGAAGSRVDARVEDAAGRAVAGAALSCTPVDEPGSRRAGAGDRTFEHVSRSAVTDAAGAGRLGPLAAGTWRLSVEAEGFAVGHALLAVDGESPVHQLIQLAPGSEVRGVVLVETDATVVAGARVFVRQGERRANERTGPDGRFSIRGLAAGPFRWSVHAEGLDRAEGRAEAPTELRVVAARLASLRLRCVDESGEPAPNFQAQLLGERSGRSDRRRVSVDEAGAAETEVLSGVDYALQLHDAGVALPVAFEFEGRLRAREKPWLIVVPSAARATARLAGTLLDASGSPAVAGCAFVLEAEAPAGYPWPPRAYAGRHGLEIEVDETTGRFELGPAPAGRYVLELITRDGMEWRMPDVLLEAGRRTELGEVRWPTPGELVVEIQKVGDFETSDLAIEVERDGRGVGMLRFAPGERRAKLAVLPGRADVTIFGTGFRWVTEVVDVQAGRQSLVRATLHPARRVRMRIPLPDGERQATFEVRDGRGALVFADELTASPDSSSNSWAPFFDRGDFYLTAVGSSGRRYRASFRVDSLEPSDELIEVRLRAAR